MLLKSSTAAYSNPALAQRGTTLAYSALATLGRKTITGMLATSGLQFTDWSANYRLFERQRVDPSVFFSTSLHTTATYLDTTAPLVALLDDTLLPKRGRCITGTAWWRDPLGPHFQANLIWGQRFVQCSVALPDSGTLECGPARAIPITFAHAPKAKKPGRKATPEQQQAYTAAAKELRISVQGCAQMHTLRARMDADPAHAPPSAVRMRRWVVHEWNRVEEPAGTHDSDRESSKRCQTLRPSERATKCTRPQARLWRIASHTRTDATGRADTMAERSDPCRGEGVQL
jgi:hypothetical protein